MKKLFICVCLISIFSFHVFSIENLVITESQVAYQKALQDYHNQDYGKALKNCEDAIYLRKTQIEKQIDVLQQSLIPYQVRMVGDRISKILPVFESRGEKESINIIEYYLKRLGSDFFEDSIEKLLEYLKSINEYPEVQKLMGDIYKVEGEYTFAEEYYKRALENVSILDIRDEKYEILYLLSDISRYEKNDNMMEKRLLDILSDDKYFNNEYLKKSMKKTINSAKNNNNSSSMENFFQLYRSDEYYSLKAYILLAEYYNSKNEYEKALELSSLAVITSFTKMYNVISARNSNFEYDGIASLIIEVPFHDDIVKWAADNDVWYAYSLLASVCEKMDNRSFARDIYRLLANYSPNLYWQRNALLNLEKLK